MRACAIVPAYDAAATVERVARELVERWPRVLAVAPGSPVLVIDDGSRDATARLARQAGARVLSHARNRGKGAALRTGLELAADLGFDVAVTVDADGQHPAAEALRVLHAHPRADVLVLGVRDLAGAGAPVANQRSNRIADFFLSAFAGVPIADTQCGLRRYPVRTTLDLCAADDGYAFESEVLLRAVEAGIELCEVPIRVVYPPNRTSHFHPVRDPARIVSRVVRTLWGERSPRRPE
jgi:glycosyltransferase involved in cell wall biosynthesis